MTTPLLVYYIYIILVDIFQKLTIRISNHNFTRVRNSNRPIVFLDDLTIVWFRVRPVNEYL